MSPVPRSTPEMAAEMYLASVMMVDEEHFMERAYLDELAKQLKLEPGLKEELEKQVRSGAAVERGGFAAAIPDN